MFNTGCDFFHDMLAYYGKETAIQLAKAYLDLPNRTENKEEYKFCCELYKAMKNAEGGKDNV